MIKFALFISLLGCFLSLPSPAQVDPSISWQKIETPHFSLIFDARQKTLADAYAARLEAIYGLLSQVYSQTPAKTVVVINDMTDSPNGWATRIPYPMIMAFPVLPPPGESISEYGDWPMELLLHEYVHILSFEPVQGVPKALRSVFGSIITPNMLLPRWWQEGIAVEYETRFSRHGRLRSKYQEAEIRALVNSPRWGEFTISEMNEQGLDSWPHGARPYLFGSLMLSEVLARSSEQFINELTQRYGGRMPYFINAPIEEKFGMDLAALFEETRADVSDRVFKQMESIKQLPLSDTKKFLPHSTGESENPAISPDGRYLVLVAVDKYGERSIRLFDRKNEQRRFDSQLDTLKELGNISDEQNSGGSINLPSGHKDDGPPTGGIGRISWFPNSTQFIYDKLGSPNPYNKSSDLYIFDVKTMTSKQISKGARLREPCVSPNGQKLAFVQLSPSATALGVADADGKNIQVIYQPAFLHRISSPVFLSNELILFSERALNGEESLKRASLDGKIEVINIGDITQPLFLSSTNTQILFSGESQGLRQVYRLEQTEPVQNNTVTPRKQTHLDSSAARSTLDPRTQEIYITTMAEHGFEVVILPVTEIKSENLPSAVPGLFSDRYMADTNPPQLSSEVQNYTAEDYSALPYLYPRYWLPTFYFDSTGYGIHAITSANDPLGKHNYQFQGGYDSASAKRNVALQYFNTQSPVTLGLLGLSTVATEPVTFKEYQSTQLNISGQYPLWDISPDLRMGAAYDYLQTESSRPRRRQGPQVFLNYATVNQSPYHYTADSGWSAYLEHSHFSAELGDYGFDKTKLNLAKYFTTLLPEGHAFKAEFHGLYTPQSIPIVEASVSQSFPFAANLLFDGYVMRGYDYSYFLFKSAANLNLEYRFPIRNIQHGNGTFPLYFKKLHGAWILDAITGDGLKLPPLTVKAERIYMNKYYFSTGPELKMDMSLGYYFNMTFVTALYWRSDYTSPNTPQTTLFFGLQI